MLQTGLSIIAHWVQDWLMSLNLSQCEHLTATNKQNLINSLYKLNDQILHQVTKAKYLGVTINQTLSWHDPSSISAIKQIQPVHFYKGI